MEGKVDLACRLLDSYITSYVNDEIRSEALVKSLDAFQRFIEVAANAHAELINFSKIADDCQVSHTACKNYFSILEDTLIGSFLYPFHLSTRKQMTQQPKFYFFDNGVNRAAKRLVFDQPGNLEQGKLFEQLVFQELLKANDYFEKKFSFYLWRTVDGAEVDFLVCKAQEVVLAIECKATSRPALRDFSGIRSFKKIFPKVTAVLCAQVEEDRLLDGKYPVVSILSLLEMTKKL